MTERPDAIRWFHAFFASSDVPHLMCTRDTVLAVNAAFTARFGEADKRALGRLCHLSPSGEVGVGALLSGTGGDPIAVRARVRPVSGVSDPATRLVSLHPQLRAAPEPGSAMSRSKEDLNSIFKTSSDGIFYMMLDAPIDWAGSDEDRRDALIEYALDHQRITEVNGGMLAHYGAEGLIGLTPRDFFTHDLAQARAAWRELFSRGRARLVTDERRKDGSQVWIEGEYVCLYDEIGCITGHFGIQRDITERRRLLERLEELAITDALTGLPNRRHLVETLTHEVAAAARYGNPLSLIMMDLDRFKRVNDQFGHDAGDRLLQQVAQLLRERVRAADIVGRWGGEEFLIVCPHTSVEDAVSLAESILSCLRAMPRADVRSVVEASFGVAGRIAADTVDALVRRADEQMYRAKEAGRGRVCSLPVP
ncbi:MAG: hypothetical protein CSA66_01520 [Proteobacteria bacterium]|nr:MAG: hypothetical protein CSA66_01520 [Pseudomonadota bacterium]